MRAIKLEAILCALAAALLFYTTIAFAQDDALTVDENGKVGIGTASPEGKLDVMGDIRAGNSDIYFTKTDHNHIGKGNVAGHAAIENAANYGALMILGRAGTSKGRNVRLWDYLQVNGGMDVTGKVGIGATSPGATLEVKVGGTTLADAWTPRSSIRWKTNIEPVCGALEKVKKLKGVYFEWKQTRRRDLGLIAEEVGEVIPEVVTYEEDGEYATSLDYDKLTAVLVEAVKDQQRQIDALRAQIEELKAIMAQLNP